MNLEPHPHEGYLVVVAGGGHAIGSVDRWGLSASPAARMMGALAYGSQVLCLPRTGPGPLAVSRLRVCVFATLRAFARQLQLRLSVVSNILQENENAMASYRRFLVPTVQHVGKLHLGDRRNRREAGTALLGVPCADSVGLTVTIFLSPWLDLPHF